MIDRFALHVAPDAHPASGTAPTAREAVGSAGFADAGLLRAVAESAGLEHVGCFAAGEAHADACKQALRQLGYRGSVERIAPGRPQDIGRFGTLYHPGPDIARLAWRRLAIGEQGGRRYSLCGIVHATASHAAMSALAGLLVAPVRSWDALICPSRVVRDSVRTLLERQAGYLGARLGATRFELPQLRLIPPGVHSRDLQFDPEAATDARRAARERLGIGVDDVAFLHAGALSYCGGAHPQQMLSALERAGKGGRTVHLLLCGCFANAADEHAFREAAALLAPSIRLCVQDDVSRAWAAADVFTALGDSVRERHDGAPDGVLLRAMAAGLPCVVGDWNGDRDLVRDGVDGYRIPTTMPGPGAGLDLAQRYDDGVDSYDQYCGHMGHAVAADGGMLAQVYARLIGDLGLRRELGANARRRAQQDFDWSVVFARYRQLWSELDERRRADPVLTPALPQAVPDRLDPFTLFASYPSVPITPASMVELVPDASLALLRQYRELAINRFAAASMPTLEEFGQIFGSIESRPMQVDELLDTLGPCDRPTLLRGLAWLCKMDLLRISPPEET